MTAPVAAVGRQAWAVRVVFASNGMLFATWASRIRENFAASALTLSSEELAAITALESGARLGSDPAVASFTQM